MNGEMDGAAIRMLLKSHLIGRIGCVHHRQPYIFPVNYYFDGSNILCQTDEGVKLNILRRHKRVCFQVDSVVNSGFWQSVLALGVFCELEGHEAEAARYLLNKRLFPEPLKPDASEAQNALPEMIDNGPVVRKIMFRIDIEEITGRFARPVKAIDFRKAGTDT